MNIYCVIFMCTFGSNNTDTEISSHNSLTSNTAVTGLGNVKNGNVASMILPERGEPVPQFGDIVMDLPDVSKNNSTQATAKPQQPQQERGPRVVSATNSRGPLAEILLPPAPSKNGLKSS